MATGIALRIWETDDAIHCRMTIPLRNSIGGGTLTLLSTLKNATIIEAIRRSGIRLNREQVGSLFGSIGKMIKKVGKLSIIKKALSVGKALINSPLTNFIAPGAVTAIKAAAGAAKLIAASKGSDKNKAKKAKLAMAAATAQAKAEDAQGGKPLPLPRGIASRSPDTRAAFRYMVTVARAGAY